MSDRGTLLGDRVTLLADRVMSLKDYVNLLRDKTTLREWYGCIPMTQCVIQYVQSTDVVNDIMVTLWLTE